MLISAVLVALIVVGTLNGLDSTNRVTSLDRSRSQADALAQQDEDQLRSEPVTKLSELNRTHTVAENGTTYTVTSTSKYIADATATSSCTSSSAKADYLQTTSEVTWASRGVSKPVVETGIISPPADSALIVQVQESGTALPGAKVVATGPSPATTPYELETSSNGCAILAVSPGEYNIYVSKPGYVDPNGKLNTHEDLSTTRSVYLPAETTAKEGYNLGLAAKLEVSFTEGGAATQGDSFVAFNTGQAAIRSFPAPFTPGSYSTTVTSPTTIFPFKSKYTIYAGSCEADLPSANGVPLVEAEEKEVPRGSTTPVTVRLAPVKIKVMTGTESGSNEGTVVENATGSTTDGCGAKRSFPNTPSGALHPGLPFGEYSMCVGSGNRVWKGKFDNNSTSGPTTAWTNGGTAGGVATIYLGTNPTSPVPANTSEGSCP
ncbi:MAG TPA: carboxypeptidase-like regulatory domain-containing protein [Solirubrobacteraceae bacterium]|nr:carboxypeptidase-like regulatory domain-containing protein [Solirubrobacteraceae bacterium]